MKKALIVLLALVMLLFAYTASFAENAATSNAVELAVVGEDEIDFDKTYGDSQTVYGVYDFNGVEILSPIYSRDELYKAGYIDYDNK